VTPEAGPAVSTDAAPASTESDTAADDALSMAILLRSAYAPAARRFVRFSARHLFGEDLADDLVHEAELAASELIANAVARSEARITVCRTPRGLRVEVAEGADASDPRKEPVPFEDLAREIIERIADRWGSTTRADGSRVDWFELDPR
jgi:hypothetical protein